MRKISIENKKNGKDAIAITMSENAGSRKVAAVLETALIVFYALGYDGKEDGFVWRIPKEMKPAIEKAFGWAGKMQIHDTLFKIKLEWEGNKNEQA